MRENIIISGAVSEVTKTCDSCPVGNTKDSCAFGYSTSRTKDLRLTPEEQAGAIVFIWNESDRSEKCPNKKSVDSGIQAIRSELKVLEQKKP